MARRCRSPGPGTIAVVSAALDRLVPASDAGPLEAVAVGELRQRRNVLQHTEQTLSYLRRLVQGRLDIVLDERHRRAEGAASRDLRTLVDDLPKILSEHISGSGRGAIPDVTLPEGDLDDFLDELDRIVGADRLGSLGECTDTEVAAVVDALSDLERQVSHYRRELHGAIDSLQEEIVRRYKSGEASVDALLP